MAQGHGIVKCLRLNLLLLSPSMRECPRCELCFDDDVLTCPTDQVNTKHTLPGTRLLATRYLLEKRLGRGAMGQVYLARDQNLLTRRVAVKTVRPDILSDEDLQEGEAIARFEREARAAASIRHPNVVDVTDFGQSAEGVFFLVMEYVEGETLYDLLRREGTVTPQRACNILRQVVAGVDAAHDVGILHRDLKPANIFLMQHRRKAAGEDGFVKVGDFGLAKIVNPDRSDVSSAAGPASRGIVGTPEYMSPEQMQPGVPLDARADIYALGTIAYHMLGGRPPFTGNITQLITQKLMQGPPPLSTLRSDISPDVEAAIMQGLAKDASDRPGTANQWFEIFEKAVATHSEEEAKRGDSRLVIMAPSGAEVYVDDERYGSVGRSGRMILRSLPPGQHVLRVSRAGEPDDERVIEVRNDIAEQIIEAQFKDSISSAQLTPSRGGSLDSRTGPSSATLVVVQCTKCHSRFAEGVKFCGRCGNTTFEAVSGTNAETIEPLSGAYVEASPTDVTCGQCGSMYPAGVKFCGRCGIPITTTRLDWSTAKPVEVLCKNCGAYYPASTRFCGRCGKAMTA
jgi:serine/threonine-protein kinase